MATGIYIIENKVNGKKYIGSSKDTAARWRNHRSELNRGIHANKHLLNAWRKYGEKSFVFRVLEECPKEREIIVVREQYYMDTLKPEYNIAPLATSTLGMKASDEARQNMSAAAKRRKRGPCSEATKAAISAANKGRKRTDEQRSRMSQSQRGRLTSEETKSKLSAAFAGRVFSDETRAKISAAKRRKDV